MLGPIRPYTELLSKYLKPLRSRMLALAVLLLGGIGLQLAGLQDVRYFIDTALARGDLAHYTRPRPCSWL